MLDCPCSKCSGSSSSKDDDEFLFEVCLNQQNDLDMKRMELDMQTPFDFLISYKFWSAILFIAIIAVLSCQ